MPEIKIRFATIEVMGDRSPLIERVKSGERVHFSLSGFFNDVGTDDTVSCALDAQITDFAVEGEDG